MSHAAHDDARELLDWLHEDDQNEPVDAGRIVELLDDLVFAVVHPLEERSDAWATALDYHEFIGLDDQDIVDANGHLEMCSRVCDAAGAVTARWVTDRHLDVFNATSSLLRALTGADRVARSLRSCERERAERAARAGA